MICLVENYDWLLEVIEKNGIFQISVKNIDGVKQTAVLSERTLLDNIKLAKASEKLGLYLVCFYDDLSVEDSGGNTKTVVVDEDTLDTVLFFLLDMVRRRQTLPHR